MEATNKDLEQQKQELETSLATLDEDKKSLVGALNAAKVKEEEMKKKLVEVEEKVGELNGAVKNLEE